jgi:membrane protein DedA with SNARE-associated domain
MTPDHRADDAARTAPPDDPRPTTEPRAPSPSHGAGEATIPIGGSHLRISTRLRRLALGVVVGRYLIVLGVVPAIPFLLAQERIALLVLLRPTKEWLLVGGAFLRIQGAPPVWLLFAAYVPLMIVVVWFFFIAGRAYRMMLRDGTGPRWLRRAIPPAKLELAQRMLVRRGPLIAVLGRLAAIPPTLLAAAAGVSDISPRRYLGADLLGAVLAFCAVVSAGFGLGEAYERGGPWITGLGVALFGMLILLMSRWIRREAERSPLPEEETAHGRQPR